jgi:SAM-dependent methyltransferase
LALLSRRTLGGTTPKVDTRAVRRAFASYRGAPIGARAFIAARFAIAPLRELGAETVAIDGRMLSLGSGYGAVERYLAEINPRLHIEGIDLDRRKVDLIASTAGRSPRVTLREGDATQIDLDPVYDAVLVCDALHHFPPDTHAPLAKAIAGCLRPGGVCIVKDLDVAPRWKYRWNRVHDRIVAGPDPILCRPPDEMAATFEDAGLVTERAERTDGWYVPYAHYVVRMRKPADDGPPPAAALDRR